MTKPLHTSLTLYILSSIALFLYNCHAKLSTSTNYFSAMQLILLDPLTKIFLYNAFLCLVVLVYQVTVWMFYQQVRQNEMMKIREKIGYKFIEIVYFLAFSRSGLGLQTFICLNVLFLMFVFHNIAIARAHEYTNTHTTALDKLLRLLVHFLLMLFINYQLVSLTFFWLFSSEVEDSSYALFAYYCLIFSMSIVQSALSLFVHFYQVYTESPIENSDILMVKIKFYVNLPRLVIEILLSLLIGFKFQQYFIMVFCIIEATVELHKTKGYYYSMKRLIDKMKNLKEVDGEELDKQADRTCTVCMMDIKNIALMLPCKHIFHKQCLRMWIIKNQNHHCPKCKKSFDFQNNTITQQKQEEIKRRNQEIKKALERIQQEDPLGFNHTRNTLEMRGGGAMGEAGRKVEIVVYAPEQNLHRAGEQSQGDQLQVADGMDQFREQEEQKPMPKPTKTKETKYIGSIPFGLPTEAHYNRRRCDVLQRERIIGINNKMIKFMKMQPTKQLLFLPQLD